MRHLNYKHLYYFWVVARDGGIANASRSLFLTPQTISGQLAALEEQLGEKLFARRGRRLELTETGRLIYPYGGITGCAARTITGRQADVHGRHFGCRAQGTGVSPAGTGAARPRQVSRRLSGRPL